MESLVLFNLVDTSKAVNPPAVIIPDKVFIVDVLSTSIQLVKSIDEAVGL